MEIEAYNNHLEISNELKKFVEALMEHKDSEERICQRTIYNRLYYAVYHKILYDNPNNQTIHNKAKTTHSYIKDNHNLKGLDKDLYENLYELRTWADYDLISRSLKPNLSKLMLNLLKKTIKVQCLEKK
ncbi:TPA: hypothetical protein RZK37_001726 [Campylobacter coli]|nr:hypothetical protein [Campylobacter coli]